MSSDEDIIGNISVGSHFIATDSSIYVGNLISRLPTSNIRWNKAGMLEQQWSITNYNGNSHHLEWLPVPTEE
jgi:hypothetical protein